MPRAPTSHTHLFQKFAAEWRTKNPSLQLPHQIIIDLCKAENEAFNYTPQQTQTWVKNQNQKIKKEPGITHVHNTTTHSRNMQKGPYKETLN